MARTKSFLKRMLDCDHSKRFLKTRLKRHLRTSNLEIEAFLLTVLCMFCVAFIVYADDSIVFASKMVKNDIE
ncbi:hypothetical protein TNCV_503851 [Trichonephila clavipes]|nr:hypothetical protein TNCV_503851 [Trichonephila clavipes]